MRQTLLEIKPCVGFRINPWYITHTYGSDYTVHLAQNVTDISEMSMKLKETDAAFNVIMPFVLIKITKYIEKCA